MSINKSRLKKGVLGFTVAGSLAIGVVGGFEGLRTKAYRDQLAYGIPTVCFGETRGVKIGDSYTVDQCKAMLGDALVEFETGMRRCLTKPDALKDKTYVSFLSLSYNIGLGAFCRSTLVRLANAGDIRGACNQFPKWNRAGGKVVNGLVRRRAEERKLCLEGLG